MSSSPLTLLPASERQFAPTPSRRSTRIDALDWTKGALIVCMVIYHAVNYSAFRPLAFQYLAFLPPSFILITGFLVGQVYAVKYDLRTWKPYLRLAARGMKLFLVFTALNFVRCIVLEHNILRGGDEFTARAGSIFLSGNGRAGIFEVLLPIAYFLLLAPALLWLRSKARGAIAVGAVMVFLLCLVLEGNGKSMKNLNFLSVGIIGMGFGLVPIQLINRLSTRWFPVLLLYLLYRLCSHFVGETYPVQTFAAAVSVLLLYCCGLHLDTGTWLGRQLVSLGQYSLLAYLIQIAVLQGIVKLFGGRPEHVTGVLVVGTLTMFITAVIVGAVHEIRQRSRAADLVYKSVFA